MPLFNSFLNQENAGTTLDPSEEDSFQKWIKATPWYSQYKNKFQEEPDLNDSSNYDYRAAYKAGVVPKLDPNDRLYHWPSVFKGTNNPRRVLNGVDTKTGVPQNLLDLLLKQWTNY